jgi:hypothetical protein
MSLLAFEEEDLKNRVGKSCLAGMDEDRDQLV